MKQSLHAKKNKQKKVNLFIYACMHKHLLEMQNDLILFYFLNMTHIFAFICFLLKKNIILRPFIYLCMHEHLVEMQNDLSFFIKIIKKNI